MTEPHSTPTAFALVRDYWQCFAQQAGRRLWGAVALLIFIGLLEGFGLLMLLPLLNALGLGHRGSIGGPLGPVIGALGNVTGGSLVAALAALVAIKVIQAGSRALSNMLCLKIETDFVCFLRDRFYRAMMQANWLVLTRQRSSDLSQALLVELPSVGSGTRSLLALLTVGALALVQVAIALTLSPAMTAFAIGSGLIVAIGLRRLRQRSHALGGLGLGKRAEMAAAISEHLAGMKVAKSHGRETQHFAHFQSAMNDIAAHTLRLQRLSALTGIWLEVGAVFALSFFVYFAVGRVDSARLLVLVFVFTRLLSHSTTLQQLWHQILHSLPAFAGTERLRESLVAAAEPPLPPVHRPFPLRDAIRFENLSFAYASGQSPAALHELNLTIPAREVTALCGPSGAGKSTLADILLGLLTPTGGRLLIDGTTLAGSRLHDWRQSVGYVPQESFLFHDTVRANLLWAQPGAAEANLKAALRAAAAEEFVDRLPRGLDTIVGDRGVRLSGGERQRIALARALLRGPTLLVLDEATSALDTHNERVVQDAIEKLHGELTIVLIAHRLSTVRMADRIVVLEKGTIVETGSWNELSTREHGAFRSLVAADVRNA